MFECVDQARTQHLHALARQRLVDAHAFGDRRVRQVVEEAQDEQPLLFPWHRLYGCGHEPQLLVALTPLHGGVFAPGIGNTEVIVDFDRAVEQPVVAYTPANAVEEHVPQHHEQEDLGIGELLQRAAHELQRLDRHARKQVVGLVRLAAGEVPRAIAQGRIRSAPSAFEQLVRLRPAGRHAATTGGRPLLC